MRGLSLFGRATIVKTFLIPKHLYVSSIIQTPVEIMKRIWEPCVCQAKPSVPLKKIANGDICFFYRKRLEPRVLPWQQHSRCHSFSVVMYISGAKFEERCSNTSGDILD